MQVQVAGVTSDVVGLTIELKPRRRNKRSLLYDLTPEFNKATGRAVGSWSRLEARHIHMLLQNELFINVATAHNQDGELRGQIKALLYTGLEAPRHGENSCRLIKEVSQKEEEEMCLNHYLHSHSPYAVLLQNYPLFSLVNMCLHQYEPEPPATPGSQ